MASRQTMLYSLATSLNVATMLAVGLRSGTKLRTRSFSWEDGLLAAGQVVAVLCDTAVSVGARRGLGLLDAELVGGERNVQAIRQTLLVFQTLLPLALLLVKTSLCLSLCRTSRTIPARLALCVVVLLGLRDVPSLAAFSPLPQRSQLSAAAQPLLTAAALAADVFCAALPFALSCFSRAPRGEKSESPSVTVGVCGAGPLLLGLLAAVAAVLSTGLRSDAAHVLGGAISRPADAFHTAAVPVAWGMLHLAALSVAACAPALLALLRSGSAPSHSKLPPLEIRRGEKGQAFADVPTPEREKAVFVLVVTPAERAA